MKIAIINLTSKEMSGGYRKYLWNVIPRLASNIDVESLLCVSLESLAVDRWFKPMQNVEFASYRSRGLFGYRFNRKLQQKIERFSPDVIFVPVAKSFKFKNIPVVMMIQNMEPFIRGINREYSLAEEIKCWLQYVAGKIAANNAARVVAISKFVRDFLVNTWHIPVDKISVAYHGLSIDKNAIYRKPKHIPLDWDKKFIFTAGSIRPARGLEDLILAVKSVNFSSLGIKGVVVAGKTIPCMLKHKNSLLNLIKANNLASRFIFLDEIDSSQMGWCYENCRLFVITSRVESFGMVGLEAMGNGCLCVVADNPCLPEIFGNYAVYYRPKDAAGLADAINSVLKWEEAKRFEMSQKARERAAEFTWEKTVKELIKELKNAVRENFNYR